MTTISWVILTHNRSEIVDRAIAHCMNNAGDGWDELVWVDNGSKPIHYNYLDTVIDADVTVRLKKNLGVAKGYNRGMAMATMDYIVITGCDMLMPDNWLRTFKNYVETIPETGVACIYSSHWTTHQERLRRGFGFREVNGLPIVDAMPIERRIFRRSLLAEFGYFPETFGLYGFDDIAWAYRVEQVCDKRGLLYYVIPDAVAEHIGTEGVASFDGKDAVEYHAMKRREAFDPMKSIELQRLSADGWPGTWPFY